MKLINIPTEVQLEDFEKLSVDEQNLKYFVMFCFDTIFDFVKTLRKSEKKPVEKLKSDEN